MRLTLNRSLLLFALVLTGCGSYVGPRPASPDTMGIAAKQKDTTPSLPMENFTRVNAGLYRGGIPTDEDMAGLKRLGIKTDVNLMGGGGDAQERALVAHEKEVAAKLGIKFVNIAIPFKVDVPQAMVQQWLQLATASEEQPVYIHCRHGRDRTGMMVAAYRIAHDGYTGQQALDEMKTFGFKPERYPTFAKFVLGFHPTQQQSTLAAFAL
ncbi:tyrosine-protein phosphatase [bacterium]|nr:tyrosine-protein phosphatase [bacterium]